jgi:broad specificity phosphatase PhoE
LTVIGFLRHGQTDWNIDFRLQGISDIPLNDTGRQQAQAAIGKMSLYGWDVIVSSPLSRAVETAGIIAQGIALTEPVIHRELLERSFGEAEGLSYEVWRDHFLNGERASGAESLADLEHRVLRCLDIIAFEYPGKRVLAVSHGAFIRKLVNIVSNGTLPLEGQRLGNLSLAVVERGGSQWAIQEFHPTTIS